MAPRTDAEIEQDRLRALADLEKDVSAKFAPGTMGCHEALHMANAMADTLDRQLLTHPAIILNPAWYARVWRACDELGALYQEIGAVHFKSDGEVPDGA
jgi:hypothetical protein